MWRTPPTAHLGYPCPERCPAASNGLRVLIRGNCRTRLRRQPFRPWRLIQSTQWPGQGEEVGREAGGFRVGVSEGREGQELAEARQLLCRKIAGGSRVLKVRSGCQRPRGAGD